jgi:hypothetical protein
VSGESDDDGVMISETWPRRRRSATDDVMLTVAGCSTWLERSSGNLNGFHNRNEPLARDAAEETPSQRREREYAHALRLRLGPEAWQNLVSAYADEIRQNLEAENKLTGKKATNVET